MKTLRTLVKFNKDKLDKLLSELNKLEEQKNNLLIAREKLAEEVKAEVNKYSGSEFAYMLDNYLANSRTQESKITSHIQNCKLQIGYIRNNINAQYRELKKYEIALEQKEFQMLLKQKKLELKMIDQFNTNRFIWNKE